MEFSEVLIPLSRNGSNEQSELDRFSGRDRFTRTDPVSLFLVVTSPDCSLAKSSGNSSDCATVEYLAHR